MEILSTGKIPKATVRLKLIILLLDHLVECMQKTFEIVQKRLLLIYALVWRENPKLFEYLERFVLLNNKEECRKLLKLTKSI